MSTDRRLYGVTIQQTIAQGNLQEMKKVAAEAEAHLASHGDVSAALETLKAEIAKAEGPGKPDPGPVYHPLYANAIHGVLASGDLQKMRSVAAEAGQWVQSHGDVGAALEVLKGEIAKTEAKH